MLITLSNHVIPLLLLLLIVGCKNEKFVIDHEGYPIVEIANFNERNFTYSKIPFGSEIIVYSSNLDSVKILIDYSKNYNVVEFFNEENQKYGFDNLKYLEIDYFIHLRTEINPNNITSESIVFRDWGFKEDSSTQKVFEFIYSEITESSHFHLTMRKKYDTWDLLAVMNWINRHPIKITYKEN